MGKLKSDADKLKEILWATIHDVRSGQMTPQVANSIAKNAKELLNSVRTELAATAYVGLTNPKGVSKFFAFDEREIARLSSRATEVSE